MIDSLDALKQKAYREGVPIMADESLEALIEILKKTDSRSLLEVGTAIGYSASRIASALDDISITSIEKEETMYLSAQANIEDLGLSQRIRLILSDALSYKPDRSYDAVFIDAAKAQNSSFFRLYFAYTDKVMIIDNVDYHGFVHDKYDEIYSRRFRTMIKRIKKFYRYLELRNDLLVEHLAKGDGLLIVRRKNQIETEI